jgi:hypothetical protein
MRGEPALNGANSHHKHTPITESPSHFGFWIADFRLSERDFEGNAFIGLFPGFQSKIQNRKSKMLFDDLVRPRQHIRRNRKSDLLSGFQIDDQLELRRLLHGKIGGLRDVFGAH